MQITEQAHLDMAEVIRRTRLGAASLEEYVELFEQLGGTWGEGGPDTYPTAGNLTAAVSNQFAEGRITTLELSQLPLLCQVAAAFGLRMDIVFTNILEA